MFKKILTNKMLIVGLFFLLQLSFLILTILFIAYYNYYYAFYVQIVLKALSIVVVLFIINTNKTLNYKMGWIVPILFFPIIGGLFFLFYSAKNYSKKDILRYNKIDEKIKKYTKINNSNYMSYDEKYLLSNGWSSYSNSSFKFLEDGKIGLIQVIEEIEKAKEFILIEFFIVNKGYFFEKVLEKLVEKAKQGVKIIFLYDDVGSIKLSKKYKKEISKIPNFEFIAFNPISVRINFRMNNRNHRKIVVIDGKVAITGGFNLSDEYANIKHKYGYWADCGIKIYGNACKSLTLTVLSDYEFQTKKEIDFSYFIKENNLLFENKKICPFSEGPLSKNNLSKNLYIQMIYQSKKSIFISTPYLILDQEMQMALEQAILRGVKVEIVIPMVADKKAVYQVSLSYANDLEKKGVKIYKYRPGFNHSKIILIDDDKACIGTVNFDYRSFYLHFENNVWVKDEEEILKIIDYSKKLINTSVRFDLANYQKKSYLFRLLINTLKTIATVL